MSSFQYLFTWALFDSLLILHSDLREVEKIASSSHSNRLGHEWDTVGTFRCLDDRFIGKVELRWSGIYGELKKMEGKKCFF
jgi:hypothetical protein